MNKQILAIAFFLLIFFCNSCSNSESSENNKPNILFIFADDLTFDAINALGNSELITPHLDALVANGTSFTHAYNMGSWSGAVCAASRAMMISGRTIWNANEFRQNWKNGDSISFEKSWPKLMERNGYDTYMSGKWHVDAAPDQLFQKVKHKRPGMPSDQWKFRDKEKLMQRSNNYEEISSAMPIGYDRPKDENDNSWSPIDTTFSGFWQGGKHWSEVLKEDAIEFIDQVNDDKPFFMYLAFNAPHDPRQAPQKYQDLYSIEDISIPESYLPLYPYKDDIGIGPHLRDEALATFPRTEFGTKTHLKEYYAIISHMDQQIGEILNALKKSGKDKNTYIFFSADHGLAMGKHGIMGKQNMFDHSMRAPLIVSGPNVPNNKKISNDVYIQDIMATSIELAGIKKPEYVEFKSFMNLVNGNTQENNYNEIYGAYLGLQRMIRKDDYKLIVYPQIEKVLLYNLRDDPNEINDLSEDLSLQPLRSSLFKDLITLQNKMGDKLDLENIYNNL